MRNRVIFRYSDSFKRQVVDDLESGHFSSVGAANRHPGIKGTTTVKKWVMRLGKNHLLAKVVRVEKPDEAELVSGLRREIAQLQKALGQTQARSLLHESYLELACERMGEEVESFKKKSAGRRSIAASKGPGESEPELSKQKRSV